SRWGAGIGGPGEKLIDAALDKLNQHHRSNRWYEEGPLKGPLGRIDDRLTLVFSPMEPLDFWIGHRRGSWSSLTSLTRSPEPPELRPDQRPFPGRDVSVTRRHAGNGRASTVAPPEAVDLPLINKLYRNPLDDVPRHLLLPPVVEHRRSRLRVPGEVLHVLHRHALLQQGGDRRHPERMRRQPRRQPGILQPPLDQLANPLGAQRPRRQLPAPAVRCPEQRRVLRLTGQPGRIDIRQYNALQVVPNRDFPALAALFLEPQHVLRPVVLEVAQAELRHGPGPAGGIGQRREDRPIP